jgi:outer membrane protein assembly factor BamB
MFHQNPAHTGEGQGPAPSYIMPKWEFKSDGPIYSSPAIVDGKVYFGSYDNYWYCIDAMDGTLVWKTYGGWYISSSPAVVDGKLYTGPDNGNVYCLDANDGAILWTSPDIGPARNRSDPSDRLVSSPCVVDGRVYVGSEDRNIYCLDANTGAQIWNYETGGGVASSPAVADGKVIVQSQDENYYCLDATNGNLIWKWNTIRPGESASKGLAETSGGRSSATIAEGKVFFFAEAGARVWALDLETGEPHWLFWCRRQRFNYQNPDPLDIAVGGVHPGDQPGHDPIGARTTGYSWVTPAYHDGSLYIMEDYFIQRLDTETGQRQWEPYPGMLNANYTDYINNATLYGATPEGLITPGDPFYRTANDELNCAFITFCSPMYADGKVYVGTRLTSLYCNDAITGKRLSWYETHDWTVSSPALGYGYVYQGNRDGNLYCFEEGGIGTYREVGSWRTKTSITASLSSSTVVEGTPLTITGSVTPAGLSDEYKGAPTVIAYFRRPDGTQWLETWHLKSNNYGWYMGDSTYEISYIPEMVGTWKVKVQLFSMQFDAYLPSETSEMTFTVTAASSSSSTAALPTTSALTMLGILAAPAIVAMPIAAILYKRKKK